ncbi:MAG TPA: ABC-2 transporter permease [Caproiciproducens sp.]|nr:ABC-2 transporter permease [Caproiciproducens sp.]
MTGLMLKDLLSLRKASGRIMAILGLYIVIFAAAGNVSFLSAMIILIMTMFIVNTYSYDEMSKWDYYALSLPVTKSQIVLSKYLLTLLFELAGILVSVLVYLFKNLINTENIMGLCGISSTAVLMAAILLPLIYKFGTQKARIWMVLLFLLPTAAILGLNSFGILPSGNALSQVSDSFMETLVLLMVPVSLLLFTLSYFLSCHIFKRKSI